jgi:hypothetical protein
MEAIAGRCFGRDRPWHLTRVFEAWPVGKAVELLRIGICNKDGLGKEMICRFDACTGESESWQRGVLPAVKWGEILEGFSDQHHIGTHHNSCVQSSIIEMPYFVVKHC